MKTLNESKSESRPIRPSVRKGILVIMTAGAAGLLAGCDESLSIQERHLLEAQHDHLRCEVYLDRLRDLYQVTRDEDQGLMDPAQLDPGPGSTANRGTIQGGDALAGGHDGPLTGGHDGPLTGGHDGPLTGGHDFQEQLLEEIVAAREECWGAVSDLVNQYNGCVVNYMACVDAAGTTCLNDYDTCIESNR